MSVVIIGLLAIIGVVLAAGLGIMIGRRTSAGASTASGAPATQFTLPKNLKTSIAGIVTGIAGFVVFSPEDFAQWPVVLHFAKFVMAGGFAAIGLLSRDFNSHSTLTETLAASEKVSDPATKHLSEVATIVAPTEPQRVTK